MWPPPQILKWDILILHSLVLEIPKLLRHVLTAWRNILDCDKGFSLEWAPRDRRISVVMQLVDLNRDQIETVNFLSYTTDTKRCAVVNLFGIFVTDVLHLLYYDVILGEKEY